MQNNSESRTSNSNDIISILRKDINEKDDYIKILEERVATLNILKEVNFYMGNSLELIDTIKNIIDVVLGLLGVTACSICIKKDSEWQVTEKSMIADSTIIKEKLISEIYSKIKEGNGELLIKDISVNQQFNLSEGSFIALEIHRNSIKYGFISLYYDHPDTISENKIELFRLIVAQLGVYVENAFLYESVSLSAIMDNLTGLYNRTYLNKIIGNHQVENIGNVGIVMADIDDFKKVNDKYGHLFGDVVLKYTGELFNEVAKKYDGTAFRYGGEEIIIVFSNIDNKSICDAADEIIRTFRQKIYEVQNKECSFTISLGVARIDEDSKINDIFQIIDFADIALYEAKKNGKNQYKLSNNM
ncbi:sensor domain-containing diguanylate cyclase [Clostridium sp. DL1XJH146]